MIDDDKEGKWFVPLDSQREGSSLVKDHIRAGKRGRMAWFFLKPQGYVLLHLSKNWKTQMGLLEVLIKGHRIWSAKSSWGLLERLKMMLSLTAAMEMVTLNSFSNIVRSLWPWWKTLVFLSFCWVFSLPITGMTLAGVANFHSEK